MWRLLMARLHGDGGGSDELFLFGQALREAVVDSSCSRCSDERPQRSYGRGGAPRGEGIIHQEGRVPFPEYADFPALTSRALAIAEDVESIFAMPLRLLSDCNPVEWLAREQERGASFKQLASIGHSVGMSGPERGRWYRIAESVPLAQRHAGHMISKLRGRP